MRARHLFFAVALSVLAVAGSAQAQRFDGPRPGGGGNRTVGQAGQFDYYLLALSWSPSYCASLQRDNYDPQCHRRDGKRYSFVLHGLWPQYERGWPQYCPTPDRGFVPRPVAERMLDIMPSEKLVFHQYRKHGTCSGLDVDGYFQASRQFFEEVRIPQRFVNLTDPRLFVSPDDLVKEFVAANPGLKPDEIVVECGGPGNRLKEVRICFDRSGKFRACGRNEDQRRLCNAPSMYVPPVREGGGPAPGRGRGMPNVPGTGQRI
jgi:ribonuclease T2